MTTSEENMENDSTLTPLQQRLRPDGPNEFDGWGRIYLGITADEFPGQGVFDSDNLRQPFRLVFVNEDGTKQASVSLRSEMLATLLAEGALALGTYSEQGTRSHDTVNAVEAPPKE